MEKQKGSVVVVAIVMVVVAITAGVIGWLLATKIQPLAPQVITPQPVIPSVQTQPIDKTTSWKTYTDEKYGFEFKYPQSYSIEISKDGVVVVNNTKQPLYFYVNIDQYASLRGLDLEAVIQKQLKSYSVSEPQKIIFANRFAYEGVSNGMLNMYVLIMKNGDNLFEIFSYSGNRDSLAENKAALDDTQKLILSTFKFTR